MHQSTDSTYFLSEPFAAANREGGPIPGKETMRIKLQNVKSDDFCPTTAGNK
jgi:hypothetical protein